MASISFGDVDFVRREIVPRFYLNRHIDRP